MAFACCRISASRGCGCHDEHGILLILDEYSAGPDRKVVCALAGVTPDIMMVLKALVAAFRWAGLATEERFWHDGSAWLTWRQPAGLRGGLCLMIADDAFLADVSRKVTCCGRNLKVLWTSSGCF